jgi:uncharacterized protein (DUF433 family)
MDQRLATRALTPRYTFPEAAGLVGKPTNTVRRWTVGNRRQRGDQAIYDRPLIAIDGSTGRDQLPLSFLNLIELRMLARYRDDAALQAIRGALDFAAVQMDQPRPLLSVEFRVHGGELFTAYAQTPEGKALLVNASRGGQMLFEELVDVVTSDIDYEGPIAHRWWPRGHGVPVLVDTQVAAGQPITAETGVRVDAIIARIRDGYEPADIAHDTGATASEIEAASQLIAAA